MMGIFIVRHETLHGDVGMYTVVIKNGYAAVIRRRERNLLIPQ